jgi:hypothetical protein
MAFTNRNTCKNFSLGTSTKTQLASAECTEIMFSVPSSITLTLFSENNSNDANGFQVTGPSVFTYSGVSNSAELSATCTGTIYYRTKYFANYNLAVQM